MRIPSFLARKVYVQGSLRNSPRGFRWEMKNPFAPVTLLRVLSLGIGGRACPLEQISLHPSDGAARRATEVNPRSPLRFDLGAELTVEVEGNPLPPGAHTLCLRLRTKEVEEIEFSLEDSI